MRSEKANPKTGQLRIRLTQAEREALDRVVAAHKGATISDVVREGLQWALHSSFKRKPCTLSVEAMKLVADLADELDRTPELVLDECVLGICDQLAANTVPLIVQEWRLRQDYRQRAEGKTATGK